MQLISEDKRKATYDEIINEMIANAWYSVVEFHVHLSGVWGDGEIKDSLEKAIVKLHTLSDLPSNASKVEIKNKIAEFDKELHGEKMTLTQNVSYKALSGFANRSSECISNMTLSALTTNREWNTKIVSTEQGEYTQNVVAEFEQLWNAKQSLIFEE